MKTCAICLKPIPKREGKEGGWQKNCSYECQKENLRRWYEVIVKKRCRLCSKDFPVRRKQQSKRKYCEECTNKAKSISKTKEKNPNWTGGIAFRQRPKYSLKMRRHNYVCRKFRSVFVEEKGYEFCQICRISDPVKAFKFDTHHIYYVSRFPKNENLHHPNNLILICRSCHRKFHGGEYKNEHAILEEKRGLKELFASGKIVQDPKPFKYRGKIQV